MTGGVKTNGSRLLKALPDDLAILSEALRQINALVETGFSYSLDGIAYRESHYNFESGILGAIDQYAADSHNHPLDSRANTIALAEAWISIVGGAERLSPVSLLQRLCEPGVPLLIKVLTPSGHSTFSVSDNVHYPDIKEHFARKDIYYSSSRPDEPQPLFSLPVAPDGSFASMRIELTPKLGTEFALVRRDWTQGATALGIDDTIAPCRVTGEFKPALEQYRNRRAYDQEELIAQLRERIAVLQRPVAAAGGAKSHP